MYNVLIVEDELRVCQGLAALVDWEMLGFRVAGFCRDGLSAQRQLQLDQYDLVVCDLHIPGMDGLDLIHWMRTAGMAAKVIIITAYAEFEYAQRAINDGIVAYLLKPVNEALFEDALRRTKEMLDEGTKPQRPAADGHRRDIVGAAVVEIHNTYGRNLTAEQLARSLYISVSKLNQLFHDKFNMSVKEYINDVRMERARFLLERTDKRIYEIASEVGFQDIDYFSQAFKKKTGCAPSQYRKDMQVQE